MAPKNKEIEKTTEQAGMQGIVTEQTATKEKTWVVKVTKNPEYCGVGAGGIQFANGQATIKSARMAAWFKEHDGYEVVEQ